MFCSATCHHVSLQVSKFPLSFMFGMCALFLGLAAICQRWLERLTAAGNRGEYELVDNNAKDLLGASPGADADKSLTAV